MAEPLLRRTFSRLRGRERRSDKLSEPPTTSLTISPPPALDPPSPPHHHITVAKIQSWARQGSVGAPPSLQTGSTPRTSPGVSQHAPGWSQILQDQKESCGGGLYGGPAPCLPVSHPPVLQDPTPPAGGSTDGQRSYLQSLERSSRAWVLSSGKAQAPEARGPQHEGGGNIWYNPIPEEDGEGGPRPKGGEVWRRREELGGGKASETPAEGANPRVSHQTDDITEHTDSNPTSTKKGGISSSVIDRLRSPERDQQISLGQLRPPLRPLRRSSRACSAKGGYLSDGDSPELLPRQQALLLTSSQETCDVSSFQMYSGIEPPRNSQRVTGLLTVHLLGLEELKSSRCSGSKQVFLAIQVDGVTRARTSLLTLRGSALPLNHAFHLQLERARLLRLLLLTPAPPAGGPSAGPNRNRVCALGGVCIPPLFRGSRSQQLCVKLEPRGLIYLKLSLHENWDNQSCSVSSGPANVFGVDLHHLVEKEGSSPPIPLLIQKCVAEIERRGLKMVGLYRLCGSASVKKDLREWFERNSSAVCLSEELYPDINVLTGILKDYLRELPSPLITCSLYQVVREAMTLQTPPAPPNTSDPELNRRTVELLTCLPLPERATLSLLLDHLSLVASLSSWNRMTHQNLAVCFGPVLLTPTQEAWRVGGGRGGRGGGKAFGEEMASAVNFKRHIEALHHLLQLWPVPTNRVPSDDHRDTSPPPSPGLTQNPLRQKQPRLPALQLVQSPEQEVVSRRGRDARLESPPPINRYAGDWSVCGRDILSGQEADYDEVAGSDSDAGSGDEEEEKKGSWSSSAGGAGLYVDEFQDFDAPFNCRLSLKDFDTLILDLDRELAKQINICL
ncbi:hypothetical protein PBY51_001237 [Eleginops maclovinus]|uniref:Rho GTPase-activating protein SYDE1 n=1 Tax=Eleginops maclovinus TaxID=56733 RepID=A0AAN8A5B2_ELEMC|nr:hypothetical protein PBY51_001237 [Eleginops maclovinus]